MTDTTNNDLVAIVLAAGESTRMGDDDKLWVDLNGAPVIAHALRTLSTLEGLSTLVIVGPEQRHEDLRQLVSAPIDVCCVGGGDRRQDSVAAGISVAPQAGWYLIHDGARPLLTSELAARTIDAARAHGAAVPGVSVADTLKQIDEVGRVLQTVDRATVRAIQTPQAFAGSLLRRAHATVTDDVTDDAAMVEALGEPVFLVEGDLANLKVTRPIDLEIARLLLAIRQD
jgi:2-C-methyl-D-erythritol 4-phosphate cytidylyltransferase